MTTTDDHGHDTDATPATAPRGPEELQRYKRLLGLRNVAELLVMDRTKDPFNSGTDADHRNSTWFADVVNHFNHTNDVHLRRIHYQTMSARLPGADGEPYENTNTHWGRMGVAFSKARDLDYVDPLTFTDRRNDKPLIGAEPRYEPAQPSWNIEAPYWALPRIDASLAAYQINFDLGYVDVTGYDYEHTDQPYLVEVWIEKSTMDDVLVPLCQRLGVNLVRGAGFESKTHIIELLQRAAAHGSRTRVLYVSDFDPAGDAMYFAVARACQYYQPKYAPNIEFGLTPIALNADQVRKFNLPRVPIKEEDKRKTRFELVHGEGAVELDALEALHPGAFEEIVTEAVQRYRDPYLQDNLDRAYRQAERDAQQQFDEHFADIRERLDAIKEDVRHAAHPYRARINELSQQLNEDLSPYREQLNEIQAEVEYRLASLHLALPARPVPEPADADSEDLLFDSRRHWLDQLRRFKTAKSGTDQTVAVDANAA